MRHEVTAATVGHREESSDHRTAGRIADGLKRTRHSTVAHVKQRGDEDAAA
jgi:hypothetical protein